MKPLDAKMITLPSVRMFSLATCRKQCELVAIDADSDADDGVSHPDDELLLAFQDAAVDYAERFTGRSILFRTWEFSLDEFPARSLTIPQQLPAGIEVPRPPLVSIERFAFGPDSESELEEGVDFTIDDYGDKAILRPTFFWPSLIAPSPNIITCRFTAGYESEIEPNSDLDQMPGAIKAAILLLIAHLYANREATTDKQMQRVPLGVESLLRPYRVLLGMA